MEVPSLETLWSTVVLPLVSGLVAGADFSAGPALVLAVSLTLDFFVGLLVFAVSDR